MLNVQALYTFAESKILDKIILKIISNIYPFYIEKHTISNNKNEDMLTKILFK